MCEFGYVMLAPCDDLLRLDAIAIHREQIVRTGTPWSVASVQVINDYDCITYVLDPVAAIDSNRSDTLRAAMNFGFEVQGWCFSVDLYRRSKGIDTTSVA